MISSCCCLSSLSLQGIYAFARSSSIHCSLSSPIRFAAPLRTGCSALTSSSLVIRLVLVSSAQFAN
ncbi:hypothetical protein PF005_g19562 [Phytophthora fragariae]|uniref:Uncharacterized protein n=1 Tax=Phytophthora fragariae TaxID=53985 RepID=A0A6A3F4A4_9STRA|nr:hypothetical protein PF003_g36837 [Phytophthora fragariae]KAE8940605.1 hypothetical protein PF009_g9584 [Phytophthora fragariae]KAE9005384.1 hypothetical protein PF011_g12069 [Phytophthora fragariae]KAE9112459.1 hypothetical protein PF007_g11094 [Phytophthora fragariae]KAE9119053.1 hypothetical protein PF010_g7998 [Phytophthora fragariae]